LTALNFAIQPDQILFTMDTLSIDGVSRKPSIYVTKYVVLPHLQTIVTGTGHGTLVSDWLEKSRSGVIAQDIDHLDQYTPSILKQISINYPELNEITSTIYHFGFSEEKNRFLGYAYRSTENWKSEELLDGIRVKPATEYTFGENVQLPNDFIELMKKQRKEDLELPLKERIGIGGDIHYVVMNHLGVNISRCHRFNTYDIDYRTMCENL